MLSCCAPTSGHIHARLRPNRSPPKKTFRKEKIRLLPVLRRFSGHNPTSSLVLAWKLASERMANNKRDVLLTQTALDKAAGCTSEGVSATARDPRVSSLVGCSRHPWHRLTCPDIVSTPSEALLIPTSFSSRQQNLLTVPLFLKNNHLSSSTVFDALVFTTRAPFSDKTVKQPLLCLESSLLRLRKTTRHPLIPLPTSS